MRSLPSSLRASSFRCPCCISRLSLATYSTTSTRRKSTNTSRSTAPRPSAASPIDDYYALLLSQPLPVDATRSAPSAQPSSSSSSSSSSTSSSSPTTPTTTPKPSHPPRPESKEDRARIVFGSRLAGPGARAAAAEAAHREQQARGEGEWVGSTWVPPRPGEPDNCCMSGCVNCVWDGYREELEAWAEVRKGAWEAVRRRRRSSSSSSSSKQGATAAAATGGSVDDDGGGSEGLWSSSGQGVSVQEDEKLLEGVPVGIREFMMQEKRLAERKKAHAQA